MLVAQGTNKQVRRLYSLQNMCKRLVSATGNCFPEPVHVGCASDYPATWENLKQLTQETNSAKQDPWL